MPRKGNALQAQLVERFTALHGKRAARIETVEVTPTPKGVFALGDLEAVEYVRPDGRRYRHEFGEEGGDLPLLCADVNGKLHVVGGSYRTTAHGIEDCTCRMHSWSTPAGSAGSAPSPGAGARAAARARVAPRPVVVVAARRGAPWRVGGPAAAGGTVAAAASPGPR